MTALDRSIHMVTAKIKSYISKHEDTDMIQCEICCGWYHRTCVNLTHEKFKELQQPNVMWMCDYHGCAEAFNVFDSDYIAV